jgi:shikimate dehydrogenase
MTTLFAIIGDPVAQARSPSVFNARFKSAGMDAVMVPMHVASDRFESTLDSLRYVKNLGGLVITVPHKFAAARLTTSPSRRCEVAGAANALRWDGDGWMGELFDGEGFAMGVEARHGPVAGMSAAIVGAGGAGIAIAIALIDRNVKDLSIWDIELHRADDVRRRLGDLTAAPIHVAPPGALHDLVVNATPIGMDGDTRLPFQLHGLKRSALVCDAIMKPPRTPLLIEAERSGHPIQEGRHMLDFQVDALWQFFGLCDATCIHQPWHARQSARPPPGQL